MLLSSYSSYLQSSFNSIEWIPVLLEAMILAENLYLSIPLNGFRGWRR
jgi:hypothetical protein